MEDKVLEEIKRLKAKIDALELSLGMKGNSSSNIRMEDLSVAGPITSEPLIGRIRREFQIGERIVQRRIDEVLFCRCGRRLDQNRVLRCQRCYDLVCEDCAILYHSKVYCLWCFKRIHDLTKSDYKILLCIASGITNTNDIFRLTGVLPETVKRRLRKFMDVYVTDKPTSFKEFFFSVLRLTHAGTDALASYETIYGSDYDSIFVKRRIKEYIKARELEKMTRTLKIGR